MVSSKATSVSQYLAELPAERRKQIEPVLKLVRANLPKGFEEGMQFGMIGWYIPLAKYPDTYNKHPIGIVALAAQKSRNTIYMLFDYTDPGELKAFQDSFKKAGKKLDMGKCCIHFKKADDLATDAIAAVIRSTTPAKLIKHYEASRKLTKKGK